MAACDFIPDLCVEVTTDPENHDVILIRETDPEIGSGPDVVVRTSRVNWEAFVAGVKDGKFDEV